MLYKKSKQLLEILKPCGVSEDTFSLEYSDGSIESIDRIYINSKIFEKVTHFSFKYNTVLDIYENGKTVVKTAITNDRITDYNDPILQSIDRVFTEKKAQRPDFAPLPFKINGESCICKNIYDDLYLELLGDMILICSEIDIKINDYIQWQELLLDVIQPIALRVENGAKGIREICFGKGY